TKPRPINVRVLSATLRDLRSMVNRGLFREDLYFRIAQARVRLPSLADRPEDVRPLVQHFLASLSWDVQAARTIASDALEAIATRDFPGNVRELKSTVERVAMLSGGPAITLDDLTFDRMLGGGRGGPRREASSVVEADDASPQGPIEPFKEAKRTVINEFERDYVARLLARAGSNVSRAAALAGIERQSLRDLLKKHHLRDEDGPIED
ncbi:MAG: sigma 54-interacting transcriptional regulator, partial [Polyangiaceae bacterium]